MHDITIRELQSYVDHCKVLIRDIDHVLDDYGRADRGCTFTYAVDFAEIYAFALAEQVWESAPFADGWATPDHGLSQFQVLARFFQQRNIVLLPPYHVELAALPERLRIDAIASVAREVLLASTEVEALITSAESQDILRLGAEAQSRHLTADERRRAMSFFESYGTLLVSFTRGLSLRPLRRYQHLMNQRPFVTLAGALAFEPEPETREVRRIYELLLEERAKRRGNTRRLAASAYLDAVALDLLRQANIKLGSKGRLLLITRSKSMMHVVEREVASGRWADIGVVVRHPRTFSASYRPSTTVDEQAIGSLQRRRASLWLFVRSAEMSLAEFGDGSRTLTAADAHEAEVLRLIDAIKDDWSVGDSLTTALSGDFNTSILEGDEDHIALRLLEFLRDPKGLYDVACRRVSELAEELNRDHELLGYQLQATAASGRRLQPFAYAIDFATEPLRQIALQNAKRWRLTTSDVAELLARAVTSGNDYDRILAMALSLSALSQWELAEEYARRALLEAHRVAASPHEAHFFLAVCIRHVATVSTRLDEALTHIDEAVRSATATSDHSSGDDARYIKERAAVLQTKREMSSHAAAVDQPSGDPTPRLAEVAAEYHRALAVAHDSKLVAQIHNNLCYLYVTEREPLLELAEQHLRELELVMSSEWPDRLDWPASIIDTVIYAQFRIRGQEVPTPALRTWVDELSFCAIAEDLPSRDRSPVRRHLLELTEALAAKVVPE